MHVKYDKHCFVHAYYRKHTGNVMTKDSGQIQMHICLLFSAILNYILLPTAGIVLLTNRRPPNIGANQNGH